MGFIASAITNRIAEAAESYNLYNSLTENNAGLKTLLKISLDMPEVSTPIEFEAWPEYDDVYLVSGGMDSYIQWNMRGYRGDAVAIFVNYGQPYAQQERDFVKENFPGAMHHTNLLPHDPKETNHIIPFRNLYLLSVANQWVKDGGVIHIGAVAGESGEGGDKSDEFFKQFIEFIYKTEMKRINIFDMKTKTKNDWLRTYLEVKNDYNVLNTFSCFQPKEGLPCQHCKACLRKCIAMVYAGQEVKAHALYPDILKNKYMGEYYKAMSDALIKHDFSHYTQQRARQDTEVLDIIGTWK